MARIQRFIAKVKKADKENPSKDKDKEMIVVPRTLMYEHDMKETMQIKIKIARRQDYVPDKE